MGGSPKELCIAVKGSVKRLIQYKRRSPDGKGELTKCDHRSQGQEYFKEHLVHCTTKTGLREMEALIYFMKGDF